MIKLKRLLSILLAVLMLAVFAAACAGGDDPAPTPDSTDPSDAQTTEPGSNSDSGDSDADAWQPRNLGGMEVIIGDWFTDPNKTERARNLRQEMIMDQRADLEAEWGYTIKQMAVAGFGDYLETFTTSVMAGDPVADVFVMFGGGTEALMQKGLLYPLNTIPSIDVHDWRWNPNITSQFSDAEGNVYALSGDKYVEAHGFIFYNKRMFEEVGLDRDLPYDLQASGEWTWEKFWEICGLLTRDLDGDGIYDVHALTGFAERLIYAFINSNNARHIGIDAAGNYYNATLEPNFIEAIQFIKDLTDAGYLTQGPPDKDPGYWNWFDEGFYGAHCAMIAASVWSTGLWRDELDDEWGMVFPPKGPKATNDTYWAHGGTNPFVLPFNTDPERAADVMFALSKYFEPLPSDLEDPNYWKYTERGYDNFVDLRAVDETLEMFYNGHMCIDTKGWVEGIDWGPVFDWGLFDYSEVNSVIEKLEAAAPVIQAAINNANAG